MLGTVLLLAQAAAAPAAPPATRTPAPTPAQSSVASPLLGNAPQPNATPAPVNAGPKTLSDLARERRMMKEKPKGSFSASGGGGAAGPPAEIPAGGLSEQQAKEAKAAQERMDKAVRDGTWTDRNINLHEGLKSAARNEWDGAAENCRKTPGCNPVYRENTLVDGHKPLRTDKELIKEFAKKNELSE